MKYNHETDTVTYETFPGETVTVSFDSFYARAFVVQHLNWMGVYRSFLSVDQFWTAYEMCDGFGPMEAMTQEERDSVGFDWSHVRDSTFETLWKVADWIANEQWHLRSIRAIIDSQKAAGMKILAQYPDFNMLELVPSSNG